jgi:phosphoribosylglycinamide formyltransferase-1
MNRVNTAILISGRGSNMTALLNAAENEKYPARIRLVLSNRPDAAGLADAADMGVQTEIVDHTRFADRTAFETELSLVLQRHDIEIVCLAGFMRLLTDTFVNRWRDNLINIHPSLLPAFKGVNTHERALAAGIRIHGATVHFVRPNMDEGPIIIQAAVPVLDGDTNQTLSERVLEQEHRIYPAALDWVASRRARIIGERVVLDKAAQCHDTLVYPPAV